MPPVQRQRGVAQEGQRLLRGASALSLGFIMVACSAIFDIDQQQCETHGDCTSRGGPFSGSVCINSVCQIPRSQRPDPSETPAPMQPAEESALPAASDPEVMDDGPTVTPPSDMTGQTAAQADGEPSAMPGEGEAAGPSDGSAGEGAPPAMPADSGMMAPEMMAPGMAPCQGSDCAPEPECVTDSDCSAPQAGGAACVDGACWLPKPECTTDEECAESGPEYLGGRCLELECRPNPRWRCEAPNLPDVTQPITLHVLVRDSLSLAPLSGIRATACQKLDLQCAEPVTEVVTDADGQLHFTVPSGFSGYLQIDTLLYLPAVYFIPAAMPEGGELQPFPLLPAGIISDGLALALGTGLDPQRGQMILIAEDCYGEPVQGVAFSSSQKDEQTVQFYVRDLLPSTEATVTGEVGNGGFLNFPAGTAVIEISRPEDGLMLTTASVLVRPGYISVAYLRPMLR